MFRAMNLLGMLLLATTCLAQNKLSSADRLLSSANRDTSTNRSVQNSKNYAVVGLKDGGVTYVDESGKRRISESYAYGRNFAGGYGAVLREKKWGFIDYLGNTVVPFEYASVQDFSEGLAAVSVNNKLWGYVNSEGQLVIPTRFMNAGPFKQGLAIVEEKGSKFYIDPSGATVIEGRELLRNHKPNQFLFGRSFSDGFAVVKFGGTFNSGGGFQPYKEFTSFINRKGEFSLIGTYGSNTEALTSFNEGLAFAKFSDGVYIIDTTGTRKARVQEGTPVMDISEFHGGRSILRFRKGSADYYEFIDRSGVKVTSGEYSVLGQINEGLAIAGRVKGKDRSIGYIDAQGNVAIPFKYSYALPFVNGVALVRGSETQVSYINRSGEVIQIPSNP